MGRRDDIGINVRTPCVALGLVGSYCSLSSLQTWVDANAPVATQPPPTAGIGDVTIRGLTIASVPDPVGTVTPHVSGRRVTLTWEAVTGASDYIVEAGSSSGASKLAQIRTGGELHLVVDEVPSGTYFVHVRATNQVGTTAPSAELTVLVP